MKNINHKNNYSIAESRKSFNKLLFKIYVVHWKLIILIYTEISVSFVIFYKCTLNYFCRFLLDKIHVETNINLFMPSFQFRQHFLKVLFIVSNIVDISHSVLSGDQELWCVISEMHYKQ